MDDRVNILTNFAQFLAEADIRAAYTYMNDALSLHCNEKMSFERKEKLQTLICTLNSFCKEFCKEENDEEYDFEMIII